MQNNLFVLGLSLALTVSGAWASGSACPDMFANGQAPDVINSPMAGKTVPLCYEAFSVLSSETYLTPLYSAEHLTADRIKDAKTMQRHDAFHEEGLEPRNLRAWMSDYAHHPGTDRGHMSPSGDMPTQTAQYESFTLANMVPQNSDNNRNLWEGIESAVRTYALNNGSVYVITGPIYQGPARKNGRVAVPNYLFKAIYDPQHQVASAYLTGNVAGLKYGVVSIADLNKMVGMDVFPGMPNAIKVRRLNLPQPEMHGEFHGDSGERNERRLGTSLASHVVRHMVYRHLFGHRPTMW